MEMDLRKMDFLEIINLIIDLRKDEGLDENELYSQLEQLNLSQLIECVVDLRHEGGRVYECGANEIRNKSGIRIIIPEGTGIHFFSGVKNNFFIPASAGDHTSSFSIPDNWDGEIGCEGIGDIETPTTMVSRNSYGIAFEPNY